MLTDSRLRSQVDQLWEKLWTGGLSNPLDAIEQFSFLLFMKKLDDEEIRQENIARRRGLAYEPRLPNEMRWQTWKQYRGADMLAHVRDVVFPYLKTIGTKGSSFERYMQNAEFKINKPNLLVEACNLIDSMEISAQNQDVQGDLYEYMLSKLNTAGRNGQFRTPRHIIRMMVQMLDPKAGERIGDLAAGTAGFLVNVYQHILAENTPHQNLTIDSEGDIHGADGSLLSQEQLEFLHNGAFRGYDNDSGMTMLRIGSMNLMLHGLHSPRFFYMDTLSRDYDEPNNYDVILMNPPFKGAVDSNDINPYLPPNTTKSELLFLHQILRVLDNGGRVAVIVPDGVLFSSSRAHIEIRSKLIEHNRLDGVVSMPAGVFKPYAGVSTAVLLFTKGGSTDKVWYYDMTYDGYSLDDKRVPTPLKNDIPDLLNCWRTRWDTTFNVSRADLLIAKRHEISPMHTHRLELEREINRLQYENALYPDDEKTRTSLEAARQGLDNLRAQLYPLKAEIDQLSQQFWVTKEQLKANKYDLSANRYRVVDQEQVFYEAPTVTIDRILNLEKAISEGMQRIREYLQS